MQSLSLDWARRYASHSLIVVPVRARTKYPLLLDWQRLTLADWPRVAKLLKANRAVVFDPIAGRPRLVNTANIGLRTGDGFIVIDVDPGGEESLAALEEKWGRLPETIESRTPRGGRHLYFKSNMPIRNSGKKLGPGIDVRGQGGFAVAPPSIVRRADGSLGQYQWLPGRAPDEIAMAPLPHWLESLATREEKPRCDYPLTATPYRAQRSMEGILRAIVRASEGNRNNLLFWASCKAGALVSTGAISASAASAMLAEAARRIGLDAREADATIASGMRRGG